VCEHHSCRGRAADRRRVLIGAAALGLAAAVGLDIAPAGAKAATLDLPKPGPRDTCPVCGMFVAKYQEWVATVVYEDGHADHFDGAKDLFKYLLNMEQYAAGRKAAQIRAIGVTGYYAGELIDARDAVYVAGSDVYGPMGHELVPHADGAEADGFMKDHAGQRKLAFGEVTPGFIAGIDVGKFDGK
jgi:nitrous oxide reductase accessory protein NosL